MREHITALLLIVDYRKFTEDLVFVGISPYEGQRHIIVKKGNTGVSKRRKLVDLGNLIKVKIYERHHWYLSESESVESFSYIKKELSLIILYQALLAVLKITYVIPEKKLFYIVYSTLRDLKDEPTLDKQELSLFILIIRVLSHYSLLQFPFTCDVCGKKVYEGYFNGTSYFCNDHKPSRTEYFSIVNSHERFVFLKKVLKHLLNIDFKFEHAKNQRHVIVPEKTNSL